MRVMRQALDQAQSAPVVPSALAAWRRHVRLHDPEWADAIDSEA